MIFKKVIFNDFHSMLLSSLLFNPMASIDFRAFHLALFKYKKWNIFISVDIEKEMFFYFFPRSRHCSFYCDNFTFTFALNKACGNNTQRRLLLEVQFDSKIQYLLNM